MYTGHERAHGWAWQALHGPNGMTLQLDGPVEARHNDAYLYDVSATSPILEAVLDPALYGGVQYFVYGDAAYPKKPWIQRPFTGLLARQGVYREFNLQMSKLRQSVEWGFGKAKQYWAFYDFEKNNRPQQQNTEVVFAVTILLTNFHTCFYGSTTCSHFDCDPPSFAEYLGM